MNLAAMSNSTRMAPERGGRPPERELENAAATGGNESTAGDVDAAIEALSTVLRDFGHYAFDVEEMDAQRANEACEKWARHLLYGTDSPRAGRAQSKPTGGAGRDWLGARHFFLTHRQREYAHVMQSVGGMR